MGYPPLHGNWTGSGRVSHQIHPPPRPPVYDARMSGLDHHVSIAMQKAIPLLMSLIAQASAILALASRAGTTRISRSAHARALRLIRPAEALVRRLIVLLANKLHTTPLPPLPPNPDRRSLRRQGPMDQTAEPERAAEDRTMDTRLRGHLRSLQPPSFALFEPNPAFARMYAEGEAIPVPARAFGPPAPTCHPARLLARLEALQAAMENREALALRHARSIPRKIAKDCFARVNPWRVGAAPGVRSRHTEPWLADMLSLFMMAIRRIPPPERPRPAL